MKKKFLTKKQIVLLLICAMNSACNSGVSSPPPQTTTEKKSTAITFGCDDLKDSLNRLNSITLGSGFDIYFSTVRNQGIAGGNRSSYLKTLLMTDGRKKTISAINKIMDYSGFSGNLSGSYMDSALKNEMSSAAKVGINYGSVSAAASMALQTENFNQDQSISYSLLLGGQLIREYSLPIMTASHQVDTSNIDATKEAIFAANPTIQQDYRAIEKASTVEEKLAKIKAFYDNHGQYFISSVQLGGTGIAKKTFYQTTNSGNSSFGLALATSFSSPYVSGSGSYSQASASSFKKDSWSSNTCEAYNGIEASSMKGYLDDIAKQITDTADSGYLDLSDMANTAVDSTTTNLPNLDDAIKNLDFTSPDDSSIIEDAKARQADLDNINIHCSNLENALKYFTTTNEEVISENIKNLGENLDPFISSKDSDFAALNPNGKNKNLYTAKNLLTVQRAIALYSYSSHPADLEGKSQEDLLKLLDNTSSVKDIADANNLNTQIESANKQIEKLDDDGNFITYMNKHRKEVCEDNKEIDQKLNCSTSSQSDTNWISQLQIEFPDEYIKAHSQWEALVNQQSTDKALLKASRTSFSSAALIIPKDSANQKLKANDPDEQYNVIDYTMLPWSTILPALVMPAVDNSYNVTIYNALIIIDDFLNDVNYYKLTRDHSKDMSQIDPVPEYNDITSISNNLSEVIKNVSLMNNKITFQNKTYSLVNINDQTDFIKSLKQYINNSSLRKSDWYNFILPYKKAGLLSPYGNAAIVSSDNVQTQLMTSYAYVKGDQSLTYVLRNADSSIVTRTDAAMNNGSVVAHLKQIADKNSKVGVKMPIIPAGIPLFYMYTRDRKYHPAYLFNGGEIVSSSYAANEASVNVANGQDNSGYSISQNPFRIITPFNYTNNALCNHSSPVIDLQPVHALNDKSRNGYTFMQGSAGNSIFTNYTGYIRKDVMKDSDLDIANALAYYCVPSGTTNYYDAAYKTTTLYPLVDLISNSDLVAAKPVFRKLYPDAKENLNSIGMLLGIKSVDNLTH